MPFFDIRFWGLLALTGTVAGLTQQSAVVGLLVFVVGGACAVVVSLLLDITDAMHTPEREDDVPPLLRYELCVHIGEAAAVAKSRRCPACQEKIDKVWEFWRDIVCTADGSGQLVLDEEKIKGELYDLNTLADEVPKVYSTVSGGRISKPFTLASEVIAEYEADLTNIVDEEVREATASRDLVITMLDEGLELYRRKRSVDGGGNLERLNGTRTPCRAFDAIEMAQADRDIEDWEDKQAKITANIPGGESE